MVTRGGKTLLYLATALTVISSFEMYIKGLKFSLYLYIYD